MRSTQPRSQRRALYWLCLAAIIVCSLSAVLWLLVEAGHASTTATADLGAAHGLDTLAMAAASPAPSATVAPTFTPQPTATPAPSATPTPARPPATQAPNRIVAPAIALDAPVKEAGYRTTYLGDMPVVEWQLPAHAAGFHLGSAYPGNPGNTVLSGHNNIQGEVFRNLIDLQAGDEVILYVAGVAYRYRVATVETLPEKGQPVEVRMANAQRIGPTSDERLTLVTCWPYTGNSHRVIVTAFPIP